MTKTPRLPPQPRHRRLSKAPRMASVPRLVCAYGLRVRLLHQSNRPTALGKRHDIRWVPLRCAQIVRNAHDRSLSKASRMIEGAA
jgi:hypothetical protein